MSNEAIEFGRLRKFFHWSIVCLLLFQIPLAWIMTDQAVGPDKLGNYALHKSMGIILFSLGVGRLIWAVLSKRPPLPADTPLYEKIPAKLIQAILYILIIMMPLSGWLNSSAANYPVSFFSLFTLPNLVEPDPIMHESFERMHQMQSYILLGAITLHALAGLRHHFIIKDDTLRSILPFRR